MKLKRRFKVLRGQLKKSTAKIHIWRKISEGRRDVNIYYFWKTFYNVLYGMQERNLSK